MCNNVPLRAIIAVLFAALCFGTTGTSQALAGLDASPLAVGTARVLVGGALLGGIALFARQGRTGGRSSHEVARTMPTVTSATGRREIALVCVGALGVLAYQPMFFAGTSSVGVALGTVIALGAAPVFTGVLDSVIQRRRPSLRWCLVTALALFGVALASGALSGAASMRGGPLGVLAALGAGLSYAVYALASKALLDRGWAPAQVMGALFGSAAVLSLPVLLAAGAGWVFTPRGLGLTLWLGVVTVAVAYLCFAWGLRSLSANTVATLTLAEPLTAALLGIIVLGETLSPLAVLGLCVLGVALVLLSLPSRERRSHRVPQTA